MRRNPNPYLSDTTIECDFCHKQVETLGIINAAGYDFCTEDCSNAYSVQLDIEEILDRATRKATVDSIE